MNDKTRKPNILLRFLHGLWTAIKAYFIMVGVLVTVVPILIILVFAPFAEKAMRPRAPLKLGSDAKVLIYMPLEGPLLATEPNIARSLYRRFFGAPEGTYLSSLTTALRRGAADPRVKGVLVDVKDMSGDLPAVAELRRALARFREAGKSVVMMLESADTDQYFLASVGTEVDLLPSGNIELTGPSFQLVYFRSFLQKIGVEFNVIRAGKYKSAMEPFIADGPSPPTLEMYESLEESLRKFTAEAIAAGRKATEADVRQWMKRSYFTANQAYDLKLVDDLAYKDAVEDDVKEQLAITDDMDYEDYLEASADVEKARVADTNDRIALIEAKGEIKMDGGDAGSDAITPERLVEAIRWARDTDNIKAVVLRISSPGGSALASDIIAEEVRQLAGAKAVVVSMADVAASGGYYIAAPATKIIADPSTITGSIGVIAALPNAKGLREKLGINFRVITQSDRAALLNIGASPTEEDKKLLAESIDETYEQFLATVAQGRRMDRDRVHQLAQGRVYTGAEAMKLGLVDGLGGLQAAYKEAKSLGGLDPEKLYTIAEYEGKTFNWTDCFRGVRRMRECMAELGATVGGDVRATIATTGLKPEERMARDLWGMLRARRKGEALALWPGYFAMAATRRP